MLVEPELFDDVAEDELAADPLLDAEDELAPVAPFAEPLPFDPSDTPLEVDPDELVATPLDDVVVAVTPLDDDELPVAAATPAVPLVASVVFPPVPEAPPSLVARMQPARATVTVSAVSEIRIAGNPIVSPHAWLAALSKLDRVAVADRAE